MRGNLTALSSLLIIICVKIYYCVRYDNWTLKEYSGIHDIQQKNRNHIKYLTQRIHPQLRMHRL